jgi:hypothetical protein
MFFHESEELFQSETIGPSMAGRISYGQTKQKIGNMRPNLGASQTQQPVGEPFRRGGTVQTPVEVVLLECRAIEGGDGDPMREQLLKEQRVALKPLSYGLEVLAIRDRFSVLIECFAQPLVDNPRFNFRRTMREQPAYEAANGVLPDQCTGSVGLGSP